MALWPRMRSWQREPMPSPMDALARAAAHGLRLEAGSATLVETGLDFRVVLAAQEDGTPWVLRIPRRADVLPTIEREAAILDLVRPRLRAAVPDWRIRTDELLAYPALPGTPGLTVSDEPEWHMDPSSPRYAASLGELLAQLHGIPVEDARSADVEIREPAAVRERWRADVARVATEFEVAAALLRRWEAWLADDTFWPDRSVMTHGEIYPGHTLLDEDGSISGVLDWTTARVDDPARDFLFQRGVAGEEAFAATVDAYVRAGGSVWPRLADHCAEMWAAAPVGYGIYALTTGEPEHREAAAAQLASVG
ncbi:macrolide 2'-phosphotransferase [Georgenia alba]|uniref:Macrolide 2'-phosphotransferase n=1 Tax=Georgenia alba TaxID=2233858 RepID=A0ABW2QAD0_9MICO